MDDQAPVTPGAIDRWMAAFFKPIVAGLIVAMIGQGLIIWRQSAIMTALPFVLVSEPGRAMVRGLAKSGKLLSPEGSAALRGFVRTTGQAQLAPTDDQ